MFEWFPVPRGSVVRFVFNLIRVGLLVAPVALLAWVFLFTIENRLEAPRAESGVMFLAFAPAALSALLLYQVSQRPELRRWFAKRIEAQLSELFPAFALSGDPLEPKRVTLTPIRNPIFRSEEGFDRALDKFLSLGFVRVGEFRSDICDPVIAVLAHPEAGAIAHLFESEAINSVTYEIEGQSNDGRRWAVTNFPDFGLGQPPNRELVRNPLATPKHSFNQFKRMTAGQTMVSVEAETAAATFAGFCGTDLPYNERECLPLLQPILIAFTLLAVALPPFALWLGGVLDGGAGAK